MTNSHGFISKVLMIALGLILLAVVVGIDLRDYLDIAWKFVQEKIL